MPVAACAGACCVNVKTVALATTNAKSVITVWSGARHGL